MRQLVDAASRVNYSRGGETERKSRRVAREMSLQACKTRRAVSGCSLDLCKQDVAHARFRENSRPPRNDEKRSEILDTDYRGVRPTNLRDTLAKYYSGEGLPPAIRVNKDYDARSKHKIRYLNLHAEFGIAAGIYLNGDCSPDVRKELLEI